MPVNIHIEDRVREMLPNEFRGTDNALATLMGNVMKATSLPELYDIHRTAASAGLINANLDIDQYGMFRGHDPKAESISGRAVDDESVMMSDDVFLGGINDLFTLSLTSWEKSRKNSPDAYHVVLEQYKRQLYTNFRAIRNSVLKSYDACLKENSKNAIQRLLTRKEYRTIPKGYKDDLSMRDFIRMTGVNIKPSANALFDFCGYLSELAFNSNKDIKLENGFTSIRPIGFRHLGVTYHAHMIRRSDRHSPTLTVTFCSPGSARMFDVQFTRSGMTGVNASADIPGNGKTNLYKVDAIDGTGELSPQNLVSMIYADVESQVERGTLKVNSFRAHYLPELAQAWENSRDLRFWSGERMHEARQAPAPKTEPKEEDFPIEELSESEARELFSSDPLATAELIKKSSVFKEFYYRIISKTPPEDVRRSLDDQYSAVIGKYDAAVDKLVRDGRPVPRPIPQDWEGNRYEGLSSIYLTMVSTIHTEWPPVYLTARQAQKAGLSIKPGAEGFSIVENFGDRLLKTEKVFNIAQTDMPNRFGDHYKAVCEAVRESNSEHYSQRPLNGTIQSTLTDLLRATPEDTADAVSNDAYILSMQTLTNVSQSKDTELFIPVKMSDNYNGRRKDFPALRLLTTAGRFASEAAFILNMRPLKGVNVGKVVEGVDMKILQARRQQRSENVSTGIRR